MFSNPIVGGGNKLIREAIMSPDYVPGISGWSINKDGSVEFNDATIRGDLTVANGGVIIDNAGVRVVDGNSLYTIDQTGGFRARRQPLTNAFGRMSISSAPSQEGGFFESRVESPSVNANTASAGVLSTLTEVVSGSEERTNWRFLAPTMNGQGQTQFTIVGDSSTGATQGGIKCSSQGWLRNTQPIVSAVSVNSVQGTVGPITNTGVQTQVASCPGTFLAGKTYKVTVSGGIALATAGSNTAVLRFRILTLAGTTRFAGGYTITSTTQNNADVVLIHTPTANHGGYELTLQPGSASPGINYSFQGIVAEEVAY